VVDSITPGYAAGVYTLNAFEKIEPNLSGLVSSSKSINMNLNLDIRHNGTTCNHRHSE
jgi:hypothetical protein